MERADGRCSARELGQLDDKGGGAGGGDGRRRDRGGGAAANDGAAAASASEEAAALAQVDNDEDEAMTDEAKRARRSLNLEAASFGYTTADSDLDA